MAPSVKGNRKGTTRSYQVQRLLFVGSVSALFLLVIVITTSLSFDKSGTTRAHAAQVVKEVSATGDVVENIPEHDHNNAISLDKSPVLKYGTAWKKERTSEYVYNAIMAGFRHIDTACQPRHYQEQLVGEGWTRAASELQLDRSQIWLQTKYTSVNGQDPNNIPYDPKLPLDEQVKASLAVSLKNLQTSRLDSWIMHGPEDSWDKNLLVWQTMESFVESGIVGQIGISNFYDVDAIAYLYMQAKIKPSVVQNRFYPDTGFDVAIRQFCVQHNIEYQSFWTLGANRHALDTNEWRQLAQTKKGLTPETLMYAYCMSIGITPLDGTKSLEHLQEDVQLVRRMQSGEEILTQDEIDMLSGLLGIDESQDQEEEESSSSEEYSDEQEEI